MRCRTCEKLLILHEAGELPARRWPAVERHLQRCPRCREALRQGERLRGLLGTAPPATPRRGLWPAVAARLVAPQSRRQSVVRRAWRPALALTTMVAAVGLALTFMARLQPTSHPGDLGPQLMPVNARVVSEDPWAGEVARALDIVLSQDA